MLVADTAIERKRWEEEKAAMQRGWEARIAAAEAEKEQLSLKLQESLSQVAISEAKMR